MHLILAPLARQAEHHRDERDRAASRILRCALQIERVSHGASDLPDVSNCIRGTTYRSSGYFAWGCFRHFSGGTVCRAAYGVIGSSQNHVGRPIIVRFSPAVPMRRIGLRRQRALLSSVTAAGAVDPHGFAAHAGAVIDRASRAPRRGWDLVALAPGCLRLSCDQH